MMVAVTTSAMHAPADTSSTTSRRWSPVSSGRWGGGGGDGGDVGSGGVLTGDGELGGVEGDDGGGLDAGGALGGCGGGSGVGAWVP